MDYTSTNSDGNMLVYLLGEFTFVDNEAFHVMAKDVLDSQAKQITLNFNGLGFIDSSALSMLLVLRDDCAANGKKLGIRGSTGRVKEVLDEMKFSKFIPISD